MAQESPPVADRFSPVQSKGIQQGLLNNVFRAVAQLPGVKLQCRNVPIEQPPGTLGPETGQAVEIIAITMGVYLLISLVTSAIMSVYAWRLDRSLCA